MKNYGVYVIEPGKTEIREYHIGDPVPDQVQVRCIANGICMGEVSIFTGTERPQYPCLVGHEGVGVVTKVGQNVKHIKEGDYMPTFKWALYDNLDARGPYSMKFTAPPPNVSAAIVEPVACIVSAWYSYNIAVGDRVLLIGAGYMGLLNVQALARSPIAELVVADVKKHNLDLAKKFGATEVVQSGTAAGEARLNELKQRRFDLVVECAGVEPTIRLAGECVRTGGRLGIFAWHHVPRPIDLGLWHMRGVTVLNCSPMIGTDCSVSSFERAIRLLESGVIRQDELISHQHPVSDVQNAMEISAKRGEDYIKGVLLFE